MRFSVFLAFSMLSLSAFAGGDSGPIPTKPAQTEFMICQQGDQAEQAKEQCNKAQDDVAQKCKPTPAQQAALSGGPSMQNSNKDAQAGNQAGKDAAQQFADACCPAAAECQQKCQDYSSKAQSSCQQGKPSPQMDSIAQQIGAAGQGEGSGIVGSTCAQAQMRCTQAKQQAKANQDTKDKDKEQAEKNKDNGGGMPQMPQMPQSPQQEQPQQAQQETPKQDCTTNPNTEQCLCIANPRACAQGQSAATAALGPGTFAGEHSSGQDGSSYSPTNSSYTPSEPMSSSASSAGAGAGGGGLGGPGGANAAAAKAAEAAGKKQTFNGSVYGGSDGGGGGGGFGGSESEAEKAEKHAKGIALLASKGPIAGFTKAGGRSNWEKVKIRYTENSGTFMKDDAAFFCMGAECKKPASVTPTKAAAAPGPAKPAEKAK